MVLRTLRYPASSLLFFSGGLIYFHNCSKLNRYGIDTVVDYVVFEQNRTERGRARFVPEPALKGVCGPRCSLPRWRSGVFIFLPHLLRHSSFCGVWVKEERFDGHEGSDGTC